jgi:hypothetical protein
MEFIRKATLGMSSGTGEAFAATPAEQDRPTPFMTLQAKWRAGSVATTSSRIEH